MPIQSQYPPSQNPNILHAPPNAADLEAVVLGAMLLDRNMLPEVMAVLQPGHFYVPAHAEVFKAIQLLYSVGKPVDLLTLREQLVKMNRLKAVGGDKFLLSLTDQILSAAHAEQHAHLVREKFVLREVTQLAGRARNKAFGGTDAIELLDEVTLQLLQLRSNLGENTIKHVADAATANMVLLDRLSRGEGAVPGIATGFYELDRTLGGLQVGMKVEVAGRPGMGKSAFALCIINHVAVELGLPVAFFSLEMPAVQQEMRLKSIRTQVPFHRLQKGNIHNDEWGPLVNETNRITAAPLYIDDSGHLSSIELRSKCLRLKHEADLKLVVIDYLQLMHHPGDQRMRNKESEIADISRATKQLAQDLGVAVIEVSQLNRNAEQRTDKRPLLSDLRESGAIEQDADVVIFPFRQSYYEKKDSNTTATQPTEAELIIAKHRNGPCRNIPVKFMEGTMTFS